MQSKRAVGLYAESIFSKWDFQFPLHPRPKLCKDLFHRTQIRMNFKSYARIYGRTQGKSAIDSTIVAQKTKWE